MNINNTSLTFSSAANPIKPFVIMTKHGKLNISEVSARDKKRKFFFYNLAKFFLKNFASSTKDPALEFIKHKKTDYYEKSIKEYTQYYKAKVNNNNKDMTLLLVKDKRNKIQGACLSYGYDIFDGTADSVCYIDSIAINPIYRGFNIGKILIEKTLYSAKNKFSDSFLTGDKSAFEFYKKLGFVPLNKNNSKQKIIIDYLSKRLSAYPKYVELFNKPLQENTPRWYTKIDLETEL